MERIANLIQSGTAQAEFVPVEALAHSDSEIALRFWQDRPQSGIKIGRDVPCRAIARLLSRIVIYEPVADGNEFRVHLAGSMLQHRFGRDITGETTESLFGAAFAAPRRAALSAVRETGTPRMACVIYRAGNIEVLKIELFQIPVVASQGNDCWVLAFAFYS